jgi:hypothetical protein
MFLKISLNIFLWKWKRDEIKVVEEYCWAITQGEWLSCCGQSSSSVLEFTFHFYIYLTICRFSEFRLTFRNVIVA